MSPIIRFAGVSAIILSLGILVSALPLTYVSLKAATGTDAVSRLCAKLVLEAKLETHLKALLLCTDIEKLKIQIAVVVALLKGCADELVKIGVSVVIDAEAKVSLVACIVSIITLCVQVLVTVSLKFGLAICAELDIALRALLVVLGGSVEGILALVAKGLTSATVALVVQVQLKLCLAVLGL